MFIKKTCAVLCFALLGACNSFNHYQLPPALIIFPNTAPPAPVPVLPIPVTKVAEKTAPQDCPIYELPEQTMTPPLPSLEGFEPNDTRTYDLIQQRHINELRMYIRDYKKQIVKTYAAYLRRCNVDTSALVP